MPASSTQPAPSVCRHCHGAGIEPDEETAIVPCGACVGTGYAIAAGDLGATRSEKRRPFQFDPATRLLTLWRGRKATGYHVSEFRPGEGFEGRAWQLRKADGSETYSCLLGKAATCDCAGFEWAGTARGNERAFWSDQPIYPGLGCRHLDALNRLLLDGWLDLAPSEPPFSVPMADDCAA